MSLRRTATRLSAWSGLWAAALLWAANMEAGQILPTFDCARQSDASTIISAACTVLAILAALISWRSSRASPTGFGSPRTLRFDATLSVLGAFVFVFALLLQTTASLVLTGCER
jgi:hypothetical protein